MKLFKNVDIFEPKTWVDRLLMILIFPISVLICVLFLAFLFSYFIFGLFILDGIYYIITGDTIVWKHLDHLP